MPRFAANLSLLFAERPFLERFEAAARAGFAAVECQFPYAFEPAALRERLQAHGLRMVLHNLPSGDWAAGERGLACHPGREPEFRAGVARAIAYAQALGVPQLNCLVGIPPPGADPALVQRTLVENLRFAAAALHAAGLGLLIEPLNTVDVPGFWLSRTDQAVALIDAVGHANLRVQYDVYHAQHMEGGWSRTLAAHLPRVGHIQIADHPGRHEPGTGAIAFAGLFALLDRAGYAGWVGCEYLPATTTAEGLGWRERLAPAAGG